MSQPDAPEPCPECKGFCCVSHEDDTRSLHVEYAKDCSYSARVYAHSCPDCDDGSYEICPDPEPAPKPVRTYEDGVATATARIVAWLREEADAALEIRFARRAGDFAHAADAIERGEHRRKGDK